MPWPSASARRAARRSSAWSSATRRRRSASRCRCSRRCWPATTRGTSGWSAGERFSARAPTGSVWQFLSCRPDRPDDLPGTNAGFRWRTGDHAQCGRCRTHSTGVTPIGLPSECTGSGRPWRLLTRTQGSRSKRASFGGGNGRPPATSARWSSTRGMLVRRKTMTSSRPSSIRAFGAIAYAAPTYGPLATLTMRCAGANDATRILDGDAWTAQQTQKTPHSPRHVDQRATPVEAVEVAKQAGVQSDTRGLEEVAVADAAHVHRQHLALHDRRAASARSRGTHNVRATFMMLPSGMSPRTVSDCARPRAISLMVPSPPAPMTSWRHPRRATGQWSRARRAR